MRCENCGKIIEARNTVPEDLNELLVRLADITSHKVSDLWNKSRKPNIVSFKKSFCYYASKRHSLVDIAKFMGKDHSTVHHHKHDHIAQCETDPFYNDRYGNVFQEV